VTRGAIQSMRDEAELAGVLAHELTHVIEQHGLSAARAAASKAGYLDATKAVLQSDDAVKFIDTGVDAVVRNGYDKPQESAADAGAVQLLIAAGYDPHSYANYLSHLAALQAAAPRPSQDPGAAAVAIKEIMSTHPGIENRFPAVAKEIAEAGSPGGATMKERFRAYVAQ
jgi:predicted Zn-dependent protease